MAWTAPMTWIPNTVLTAAQLNTHVRDNLLETAPAKSVGNNRTGYIVVDGPEAVSRRQIASHAVISPQKTDSSSWTDLDYVNGPDAGIGPTVRVKTGTSALVMITADTHKSIDAPYQDSCMAAAEIFGATKRDPDDSYALKSSQYKDTGNCGTFIYLATDLTPGTNWFRMKYKVTGSTDTVGTFMFRRLIIMPL